jgi:hypothetical protein
MGAKKNKMIHLQGWRGYQILSEWTMDNRGLHAQYKGACLKVDCTGVAPSHFFLEKVSYKLYSSDFSRESLI